MQDEKLVIEAKQKKKINKLVEALRGLGFSRVSVTGGGVVAEKFMGDDLAGKAPLDYRIVFGKNSIEFNYHIQTTESKKKRLLSLFPIFLNAALLAENEYEIKLSTLFSHVSVFFNDFVKTLDKDTVDLATELEELEAKHSDLSKKYSELVRSSEENARLLLECERHRDELHQRSQQLEKLSDGLLKEELYKWIKLHEGSIDLEEFCKAFGMPLKRAEEGLDMLMREGYLKKRND